MCVLFYFGVEAVYQFCNMYFEQILLFLGSFDIRNSRGLSSQTVMESLVVWATATITITRLHIPTNLCKSYEGDGTLARPREASYRARQIATYSHTHGQRKP